MFVFETDDDLFITELINDSRILHVEKDAITSHISNVLPISVINQSPSPPQKFTRTITHKGSTVDDTLITGYGNQHYWPLNHLMKKDFTLASNATYNSYSYSKTGSNVDAYIIDTGVSSKHPFLFDSAGNTRVHGLPGFGFQEVTGVTLTEPGSGYYDPPLVFFIGGGGTGAVATTTISPYAYDNNYAPIPRYVTSITLISGGSGYTSTPTVEIFGGGMDIPSGAWPAEASCGINGEDDDGHGTNCAQCIGGDGHNGLYSSGNGGGGPGVAKECKFYAVKVFDNSGQGASSVTLAGINAVIAHNDSTDVNYKGNTRPSLINYSINNVYPVYNVGPDAYNFQNQLEYDLFFDDETGSWTSTLTADALKTATTPSSVTVQPIHVIHSTGNGYVVKEGSGYSWQWYGRMGPMQARTNMGMIARTQVESGNTDPGQGNTICVGATEQFNRGNDNLMKPANFSNYGSSSLSIWAPGKDVIVANWEWTLNNTVGDVVAISGTSFSTPYVAGLVALRLEDKPTELPADTKEWLLNTSTGGSTLDSISTLLDPVSLSTNPISASGHRIHVNWPGHNLVEGDILQVSNSTGLNLSAVWQQQIPADKINGWHYIFRTDDNNIRWIQSIPVSSCPAGGGSSVQVAKVTDTFEETDGMYQSEVYKGQNPYSATLTRFHAGGSDVWNYFPVDYSDNKFFYSPYQEYTVVWAVAAGSLGTFSLGDSINVVLSAQMISDTTETPMAVTYSIDSLPIGTNYDIITSTLTGILGFNGIFNFTITADNGYFEETRSYNYSIVEPVYSSMSDGITLSDGIWQVN
jgi:subtilisin family serine protease